MTKYIVLAVLGGVLISSTAFAAAAQRYPRATLFGVVEPAPGVSHEVYKLTDGATDCYIVESNIPAISCVK